jgi:hypothetical protein
MDYPTAKTRSLNVAFVVNAEHLRSLAEILGEDAQPLEYTVKFSDGTSVLYSAVEEIIGQPNSSKRSIVSLIAGPARHPGKSAYVNLKSTDYLSESVEYTINGPQRDVVYLADKLDDWVAGIRLWYSPVFVGDGMFLYFSSCALAFYAGFIVANRYHSYMSSEKAVFLFMAVTIATFIIEYFAFTRLFPRATFAIGRGEQRHTFLTYCRNTVLVGLGLSVVGSVVANWKSRRH